MGHIRDDMVGGFNAFIAEQKKSLPGEVKVTLITFNQDYDYVFKRMPINEVPELTGKNYAPGGMTALMDALGVAIDDLGAELVSEKPENRPGLVTVVIMTDGHENCSKEYTQQKVHQKITTQQEQFNWNFVYLGANQDAVMTAQSYGIDAKYSCNVNLDGAGAVMDSYRDFAKSVTCVYSDNADSLKSGN